jgi:hypothetical protein
MQQAMIKVLARAAFGAGICAASLLSSCQSREPRAIYLVPDQYVGWICVYYGESDAPPLPREDAFRVLRFGPDGVVRTNDFGKAGTEYEDRFYYLSGATTRKPIPPEDVGGGGTFARPSDRPEQYVFFLWIGADRARFRPAIDANSVDKGPRCGPV